MTHNIVKFTNKNLNVLPQRLREAREALEMTMIELANRIGITRQAISLYEAGARTPEPHIMTEIVRELKQPISFFITDRPNSFGIRDTIYFRSFKSKTKKQNKHCEIYANWFSEIAYYVTKFVNTPTVNLPEISPPISGRYSFEEIESAAIECRKLWGLNMGPINNLVNLLECNGITVTRLNSNTETIDAFSFWQGTQPFIFLKSSKNSSCRSRFDAAHELGHLILHRGISELDLEKDLKHIEKEADKFASAFLLPFTTYPLEVFSVRLPAFIELKKRWKVSIAAQITRCLKLGIITEDQALSLRKQLSTNKWRKIEPLDKEIPFEQPQLIEGSFKLLLENHIKDKYSILSDLNLSNEIMEQFTNIEFNTVDSSESTAQINVNIYSM